MIRGCDQGRGVEGRGVKGMLSCSIVVMTVK